MADVPWGGAQAARFDPRSTRAARPVSDNIHRVSAAEAGDDGREGGASVPGAGEAVAKVFHASGAVISLALIAGLAVWGYKLAVRDVTGVPVVRALSGPMRIQPDDPGGVAAAHQGFAVNSIAADEGASTPADEVMLAPSPMALSAADVPARSDAEVSAVEPAEAGDAALAQAAGSGPKTTPEKATALSELPAPADPGVAAPMPASVQTAPTQPIADAAAAPTATAAAEVAGQTALIPASLPGVRRSPLPAPRPADLVTRAAVSPVELAVASAAAAAPIGVRDVDPAAIAAGTRLVQLGAFASPKLARATWNELAQRFPEMLDGKDRVIQKAQSGGKTFYRLRAMGFDNIADARGFCAALIAGRAACIPAVQR